MITFPVKFGGYKTIYASDMPSFQRDFAGEKTLNHGTGPDIAFTRASSATFFDSAGVLQTAGNNVPRFDHDPTRVNLLLHSEAFDNAVWAKTRSSVSANVEIAPDGTLSADKLVENTDNNTHLVSRNETLGSIVLTFSVFLKAGERARARVRLSDLVTSVVSVDVNLSNGTLSSVSTQSPWTSGSATIQNVGNGWYRIALTATAGQGASKGGSIDLLDNAGNPSYAGDGTSGLYIWGAQLQIGSTATTYVPTTTSVAAESRGLLIEESRTNSIRNSTMQGAVAGTPGTLPTHWAVNDLGTLTRQVVGIGTENGISYIDIRFSGTTSNVETVILPEATNTVAAVSGQTWTSSLYVKVAAGSLSGITNGEILVIGRDTLGGVSEANSSAFFYPTSGNLSQNRFSHTLTLSSANTASVQSRLDLNFTNGVAIDVTLRIAAPQLERGAFATSFIPTTNAAVTRSGDLAVVTPISSFFGTQEGTLYSEFVPMALPANAAANFPRLLQFGVPNGAAGGVSTTYYNSSGFLGHTATVRDASGVSQLSHFTTAGAINTTQKVAFAYKENSSQAAVGGNFMSPTEDTSGSVSMLPNLTHLWISATEFGAVNPESAMTIAKVAYYPKRLSSALLQKLTT